MADQATAIFEYAGVPLLFDHNQQAQRFMDRYLPLEQMVAPPENTARDDWHSNSMGQGFIGLPRPNYPPPPPPRINTLYWPIGATRWARGWFLCDTEGVEKLTDTNWSDSPWSGCKSVGKDFKASAPVLGGDDASQYVLTAFLYMLRPHRITATNDKSFGDLWLVPLVDRRYFWQFERFTFSRYDAPELASWDALLDAMIAQADSLETTKQYLSGYDPIESAYMKPDPVELYRMGQNFAVVFDAAVLSVERRLVVHYTGEIEIADSQDAFRLDPAYAQDTPFSPQQAGTKETEDDMASSCPLTASLPETVSVFFPRVEDPGGYGATMTASHAHLADLREELQIAENEIVESPASHAVLCTAWAMFQCGTIDDPTEDAEAANKTNLDALALQYAKDYYRWRKYEFDYAWPGIKEWTMLGSEDHILFEFGTEYIQETEAFAQPYDQSTPDVVTLRDKLARRFMTRVQSMPANFGVSSILCQYEHAIPGVADGLMVKTPSGGIAARDCYDLSSACCKVYHADPAGDGTATLDPVYCDDSNTHWQIRVYNIANAAVSGDALVLTDVLKNGLRVVTVESCSADSCPESSSSS